MGKRAVVDLSKFLSFVLRHEPGAIGLTLDPAGWVDVDALLERAAAAGKPFTREVLETIVATSEKQRFALSDDGKRIRANQGHSVSVELGYSPAEPPERLFHGTGTAHLAAIRAEGLRKMARHHVHLSPDVETARVVAIRRGAPVILEIAARRMRSEGHVFFVSTNGVWLTDGVPPEFIVFPHA